MFSDADLRVPVKHHWTAPLFNIICVAAVTGLLYVHSRNNSIAMAALSSPRDAVKAGAFVRKYGSWSDVRCQAVGGCRQQARSFPTLVNTSQFAAGFTAALLAVVERNPCLRKP